MISGLQGQAVANWMQSGFRASVPGSCQLHVKWIQGFSDKQLSLGCKVVSKLQQQAVVNQMQSGFRQLSIRCSCHGSEPNKLRAVVNWMQSIKTSTNKSEFIATYR